MRTWQVIWLPRLADEESRARQERVMTADNLPGAAVNGGGGTAASSQQEAVAASPQLQEWKVTLDTTTGLVTKLEKLRADGAGTELSYEGTAALALAYGVAPELVEATLSGKPPEALTGEGVDLAAHVAWRRYASIPMMLSYWQGYADAVAARPSSS
jgi:hypothetical protein